VKSVLIVEEHEEMRAALRSWLLTSLVEPRLTEARSAEEALAHAARGGLDLVLVNFEIPGLNGVEAARELRRRHPSCPVVVMSVNDSEILRSAALEAGAYAFLSKRELPSALLPILHRLRI
jgi:DNA-binding NarL/FixJ family response regulator